MIPSDKYKKIHIQITSKKKDMNDSRIPAKRSRIPTFICDMCLNSQSQQRVNIAKNKPCPICSRHFSHTQRRSDNTTKQDDTKDVLKKTESVMNVTEYYNTVQPSKIVQTSKTEFNENVDLLNEVLTVFQKKKHEEKDNRKECVKTVVVKDACVSTDFTDSFVSRITKNLSKLEISNTFRYSIEGEGQKHENFVIVNRCEPQLNRYKKSGIDLIKHKSDSIPLMKMDELKKSLREKTKSKDAIEEVNRMFATFKKRECVDDSNRPLVRNGPRVLPVVKTATMNDKLASVSGWTPSKYCKFCQTQNYYLSSGDSKKNEGCQMTEKELVDAGNCDKSIFMMCCHYQKDLQAGLMVCECCQPDRSYPKRYGRRDYDDDD